jgi:putative endonuclease
MQPRQYHVYILTNTHHTVYYTGITNNLIRRVYEHKNKLVPGFTEKYNIWKLIYYEEYDDVETALNREKQVKDFRREKKLELIKTINPKFEELLITS